MFASHAERASCGKLKRRWGDKYAPYHNLPCLIIFTLDSLIDLDGEWFSPLTIDELDQQCLKKTCGGCVLCESATDKPLVAIHFDGMHGEFDFGREYRPADEIVSPWGDRITVLKLKFAHESLFPYFVVGSQHFANVLPRVPEAS